MQACNAECNAEYAMQNIEKITILEKNLHRLIVEEWEEIKDKDNNKKEYNIF